MASPRVLVLLAPMQSLASCSFPHLWACMQAHRSTLLQFRECACQGPACAFGAYAFMPSPAFRGLHRANATLSTLPTRPAWSLSLACITECKSVCTRDRPEKVLTTSVTARAQNVLSRPEHCQATIRMITTARATELPNNVPTSTVLV